MKRKSISIIIVLVLVATVLCGCGTNTTDTTDTTDLITEDSSTVSDTSTTTNTSTTEEKIDISIFPELKSTSENLGIYREEVLSRTKNAEGDDIFISDKDWDIIQLCWDENDVLDRTNISLISYDKLYNETSKYYYPVVFRDGNLLYMWYTTEYGSVDIEKLYGYGGNINYIGQAHTDAEGIVLAHHSGAKIIYSQETGKVDYYGFGEKYETVDVPKGAEYCGHSYFEGHLFRVGSDVYALRTRFFEEGNQVQVIAHNVEYVIDASYDFGSDPWSQPLFLMKDGTVKCYISWEGDKDAAPDHSSHLCDLQYEGGYHKGEK